MLNDHDEESDQVHDRYWRDADQDRRLIYKPHSDFTTYLPIREVLIYEYQEKSDPGHDHDRPDAQPYRRLIARHISLTGGYFYENFYLHSAV